METFAWPVDTKPTGTNNFRTRDVKFGDGYEQSTGNGINNKWQSWSVSIDREPAEMAAVMAFLDRHEGYKKFLWTPPGRTEGRFKCRSYQEVPHLADQVIITATFEQTF